MRGTIKQSVDKLLQKCPATHAMTRVTGTYSFCRFESLSTLFTKQYACLHYVLYNMSSCLTSKRTDVAFLTESGCKVTTFF
jgi:hypothetical protein